MAKKNLVAVTPGGEITEDMLAGAYMWYSIPDAMMSIGTVRRAVKEVGLDLSRFPTGRRPEHVAQEACRKVEGVHQNGTREEIRAEQVVRDADAMIYQITKHVQDKDNRVIEHPKALRVIFDIKKGTLEYQPLGGADKGEVQDLIDKINDHFEKNSTKMPGHKLRTILRHYIEAVGGENVRGQSGGVYFLAKKLGTPALEIDGLEFSAKIVALLTALYKTPDTHVVKCVNDEGERAYLKRKFIENCSEDLEDYREKLLELVRTKGDRKRGFREDMRANLIEQRKAIDARRARFADILQDELGELDRNMKLADSALKKFLTEAGDDRAVAA
jgi:hypothetical protein